MKKHIVFFVFVSLFSSSYGMEPKEKVLEIERPGEETMQQQEEFFPFTPLPPEIKAQIIAQHINAIVAESASIEDAAKSIHAISSVNREFNYLINDPQQTRLLIERLAEKFDMPQWQAAALLGTKGAIAWLNEQIKDSNIKKLLEDKLFVIAGRKPGQIKKEDLVIVKNMLKTNIDVNVQDKEKYTALNVAAMKGNEQIVDILLTNPNTNLNIPSINGETPLIHATESGTENIVTALLKDPEKINVNLQDTFGDTALISAAARGNIPMVTALLKHPEININIPTNLGDTALTFAILNGHKRIAKTLLNRPEIDVNINVKARYGGGTALDIAERKGYSSLVELLKAKGAKKASEL